MMITLRLSSISKDGYNIAQEGPYSGSPDDQIDQAHSTWGLAEEVQSGGENVDAREAHKLRSAQNRQLWDHSCNDAIGETAADQMRRWTHMRKMARKPMSHARMTSDVSMTSDIFVNDFDAEQDFIEYHT